MQNINVVAEPEKLNEISFEQRLRDLRDSERKEQEQLKRVRKSPFTNFYQVNKEHLRKIKKPVKNKRREFQAKKPSKTLIE